MTTLHPDYEMTLNSILMQSSSQLLVGLDFSLLDHMLIKRAAQMAQKLNTHKLVFVHVINDDVVPEKLHSDFKVIHEEEEEKFKQEMIEEVEDNFPLHDQYDIEYVLRRGRPLHEFMKFCRERNFSMMILGKKKELRGHNILPYEIARYSNCPILFVPENIRLRLKNIMVCNDFSVFSKHAMEFAIELASAQPEEMTVYSTHVYNALSADEADEEMQELEHMNKSKLIKLYNEFLKSLDMGEVHITPIFSKDEHHVPYAVVQEVAQKKKIDLLVIGARGRSISSPTFINSMTEKLLNHVSDVPILVTKRPMENGATTAFQQEENYQS